MKRKKAIQNFAIILLVLVGVKNLVAALPLKSMQRFVHFYTSFIHPQDAALHHLLSFVLGALMLLLAHRLYRRVRLAWVAEVAALTMTIAIQAVRYHSLTVPVMLLELFVLVVLCISHEDFTRKSDPLTVKAALRFVAASIILLLLNATVGIYAMRGSLHNVHDVGDALTRSVQLLVLMDTDVMQTTGRIAELYAGVLISINWVCIFASVALLLKPLVYVPLATRHDRERVRALLRRYGQNSLSYLALENNKKYFFSSTVEGVCAYTVVSDVFVVCGDPICSPEDGRGFLTELLAYCTKNAYRLMLLSVTDCFRADYLSLGFGMVKLGEETCFHLDDYNLQGGKVAKVRAAINHATKAGITVCEYKPAEGRDARLERQIEDISAEWLKSKGGKMLQFMVGGTGLNDPLDRRYFYACDSAGTMLGFVVFLPYLDGYLADVTRRRSGAPQGVLEKIICEAWMKMRDEGIQWGSMGLATLYNVAEADRATLTEKLFTYIYENLNNNFGFQNLHHAKEKYAPTHWFPRHMAFYPKPFSPRLAYALVRCQSKTGLLRIARDEIRPKADMSDTPGKGSDEA